MTRARRYLFLLHLVLLVAALAACSEPSGYPDFVDSLGVDAFQRPCVADCECPLGCCAGGICQACGRMSMGICGGNPQTTRCPCVGGTCVNSCCVLPDGAIDRGTGLACMPPDGGDGGVLADAGPGG